MRESAAVEPPLVVGGGLRIAYDIALWRAFRHVRPPEEVAPPPR